ncbi:hypothetical protein J4456_04515 [Candidatus Pacearchaeota archaeon]|nr:hypothetical protein [Candidatus Pacearchaeota archaeon]
MLKDGGYINSDIEVVNGVVREIDRDSKRVIYDIQSPISENIIKILRQNIKSD